MTDLEILERSFRPLELPERGYGTTCAKCGTEICGVYILVDEDEIVYVGSSVNIHRRVYAQKREKSFERALFLALPRKVIRRYEAALIRGLSPEDNVVIPGIDDAYDAEILYGLGLRDTLTEDDIVWQEVA